ncbi:trehalose-phosphatase [Microvirga thermotolerans]|uniref:Trehalose 6-phosphate phosphatase n=1 Tax=Microvirga thermotolerans TaxID=2651334 RepID=A0A5P9JYT6_9HYPH|nr:trehalose-phosphatase [Microvirga thermotolerans]QFU17767.1 trehalose-phosphatase [Microvirga thermotolerans]
MAEALLRRSPQPEAEESWALFLDFDGTLVDIVERPEAVFVDPALPGILAELETRLGGALAIVSGRPISFLDRRLGGHRFDIAGLHGLEHRIGGQLFLCDPDEHPRLREMVDRLAGVFSSKPGILIEDKGCSVAIHWRLAPIERDFVHATVHAALEALGSDYRVQFGKAVAEILPAAAGKGKVIEKFLVQPPYRGRRPIFIGDDLTDENGFRAVNALGGYSVRIGPGETVARERLGSPAELRHSLALWAEQGSIPFQGIR